jgi:hypothetical protein
MLVLKLLASKEPLSQLVIILIIYKQKLSNLCTSKQITYIIHKWSTLNIVQRSQYLLITHERSKQLGPVIHEITTKQKGGNVLTRVSTGRVRVGSHYFIIFLDLIRLNSG